MHQKERVLIVGISTRALAESAVRAGYAVLSVDGYGDLDNPGRPALSLARDVGVEYSAHAAADAALDLDYDAVCYCSNFENHPRQVAQLSRRGELWGNSPAVLRRARDPLLISRSLRGRHRANAEVRASAPIPRSSNAARGDSASTDAHSEWLAKPRASGGGHGISQWRVGDPLPRSHILQERIAGIPGSIAFIANGQDAVPFAISRQLVGDAAFGAAAFQYCGSILAAQPRSLIDAAAESAQLLTELLGLVGLNCADFVVRDGAPHVIEINPRYSASMELAERAFGFSVFAAHASTFARRAGTSATSALSTRDGAAITSGATTARARDALPRLDLAASLGSVGAFGKAVLFAPRDLVVGDTRRWLDDPDVRDIPHPGECISRGHPMCTIFATARDDAGCYAALSRKARELFEAMRDS